MALITGASSGIGAATAQALAARGVCVALLARTQTALDSVAHAITARGGTARVYAADAANPVTVDFTARRITAELGTPDIIVNSAGAGRWLFTEETEPDEAIEMMAAPYFAAFFITRAFLPPMLARGSGHIVNLNSPLARIPWPGASGYAGARGAMQTFTNALRTDLYRTGLHVTSIIAAEVRTPYFTHNPGTLERAPKLARLLIPALEPEQVARAILRAVEREQREIVMPFMLQCFFALNAVAPRFVEWLATVSGHQHTRSAQ
ncbi:MAG: SDR family NAD(P)-dependent oxidoreductase [Anaerolineales bacterium]